MVFKQKYESGIMNNQSIECFKNYLFIKIKY